MNKKHVNLIKIRFNSNEINYVVKYHIIHKHQEFKMIICKFVKKIKYQSKEKKYFSLKIRINKYKIFNLNPIKNHVNSQKTSLVYRIAQIYVKFVIIRYLKIIAQIVKN